LARTVVEARRQWTEARPEDFEKVGKYVWRDKATGIEYREEAGSPLLSIGTEAARFISAFFVLDGRLVFLARADVPQGTFIHHGEIIEREVQVQLAPRVIQC